MLMKTLKNVESMYRDYEEGSMVVIDQPVDVDSLKSFIADAIDDVVSVLKSNSKMVVDSKKYGHGVAEESEDGYSRQMVPPEHQVTRADTNAPTSQGAWDVQRQKLRERKERGETPEKGWKTKKSISAEDASGIIETILSIKSILKGMGRDIELDADKHEELEKLRVDLNKEEDAKNKEKTKKSVDEMAEYDKRETAKKNEIFAKAEKEGRSLTKEEQDKAYRAHMD